MGEYRVPAFCPPSTATGIPNSDCPSPKAAGQRRCRTWRGRFQNSRPYGEVIGSVGTSRSAMVRRKAAMGLIDILRDSGSLQVDRQARALPLNSEMPWDGREQSLSLELGYSGNNVDISGDLDFANLGRDYAPSSMKIGSCRPAGSASGCGRSVPSLAFQTLT